jgi:hypothetical protein
MLPLFTPHLRLASVLELDVSTLRSLGLEGLLLDLDCTLKDYPANDIPLAIHMWVQTLRAAGIRLCLLSNGKTTRIERFARMLDIPFVAQAFKPLPLGCRAALKKIDLPRTRAAVVGDQIFADILAGRLAGMFTILVHPTSPEEPWFTRLKRPFERAVLRWTASIPTSVKELSAS